MNSLSSFFCDLSTSISGCFGLSNNNPRDSSLRKVSHAFPAPLLRCKLIPSDKHDGKFYYINDEVEVDKTIAQLDEAANIDESQAETLELTLSNLRELRNKLAIYTLYDLADDFEPVREVADEETPSSSLIKSRQTLALTSPESHINKASPTIFDHSDSSGSKFKREREIRQGTLVFEVQKGFFFHPKFLQKHNLGKPYVQTKIYHMEKAKNRTTHEYNSRGTEVATFKTQQAANPLHTEWDELFEYKFMQDKKVSSYSFGFTLFYTCNKGNQDFQVGEEQIFSIGSLLDQSMQTKFIDFVDQDLKGLLARLGVRFQFLHDPELVKDRLLVEVKTKIEKLLKIKERHPIFLPEKKERTHSKLHVPKLSSYSHRGSEFSLSSTHENDDHGYYLSNK